jgi:predicted nucleic acid-binding protein
VITLDTSGIGALLDTRAHNHAAIVDLFLRDGGPYIFPALVMAEISWFIEARLGAWVLPRFLADFESGNFTLDCSANDLTRIRELVTRYDDLPLGFADASVVACAERHGGTVLTLDSHFGIVARDARIRTIP